MVHVSKDVNFVIDFSLASRYGGIFAQIMHIDISEIFHLFVTNTHA